MGELRVTVVADEADELPAGEASSRVAFVPTERLEQPRPGEMTVRLDGWAVAGEIAARAPARPGSARRRAGEGGRRPRRSWSATRPPRPARCGGRAAWPRSRSAPWSSSRRPHLEQPADFIALTGAGAKVNKLHFWIEARADSVRIGRFAKANPVHANGQAIRAGEELEVALPAEISLSHGDLVLSVSRTSRSRWLALELAALAAAAAAAWWLAGAATAAWLGRVARPRHPRAGRGRGARARPRGGDLLHRGRGGARREPRARAEVAGAPALRVRRGRGARRGTAVTGRRRRSPCRG